MKTIILIIISTICLHAQNWEPAGIDAGEEFIYSICNDSINDILYVADFNYNNKLDSTFILRYMNNKWDTMPGIFDNTIRTLIIYNNELYAGGNFEYVDSIKTGCIARWDGTKWNKIDELLTDYGQGAVFKLRVFNDTLYVVGAFNHSSSGNIVEAFAKLVNNQWKAVYNLPYLNTSLGNNRFSEIAFYNNEIFLGGNFDGDTISDFIKFDGEKWVKPELNISGSYSEITTMAVYKDELYVGGNINMSENKYIQRYNGQDWNDVGLGLSGAGIIPYEFKVHNNELYVCGKFDYAGGVPAKKIAKWNGDRWCGLGGDFTNYTISAIEFYRDTLYVACGDSVDNIQVGGLAKWVGGNYVDTCSVPQGIEGYRDDLFNLIVYPNPTNGKFNIKLNSEIFIKVNIKIYNINGCKLFEKQYFQSNEIKIDNIAFEKGIYLLKIETDKFIKIKKLIIN